MTEQHSTSSSDPNPNSKRLSVSPVQVTSKATDSPWLWLGIFVVGALVALLLTVPKYSWRQPQIERQFQARERSGHAVSAGDGYSPLSNTTRTMLTLRPLFIFFVFVLLLLTMIFWARRLLLPRSEVDSQYDQGG